VNALFTADVDVGQDHSCGGLGPDLVRLGRLIVQPLQEACALLQSLDRPGSRPVR
jgi:hypothetical protein